VLGLQAVTGGPVHVESIQNYNARLIAPVAVVSGADDAGEPPQVVGEAA